MAVGSQQAHHLLHRRQTRRFSCPRPVSRLSVSYPDRAQADWRTGRSSQVIGRRSLRAGVLLFYVAEGAITGKSRAGEGSASVVEPVADLRRLRSPPLLSEVRARLLRDRAQAVSERGEDVADCPWHGEGNRSRHLPGTGLPQTRRARLSHHSTPTASRGSRTGGGRFPPLGDAHQGDGRIHRTSSTSPAVPFASGTPRCVRLERLKYWILLRSGQVTKHERGAEWLPVSVMPFSVRQDCR